jgi:hypothetical protein
MCKWGEYNKKLVNQSRIEIYFSEEVLSSWYNQTKGQQHRPQKFSDIAIKTCLIIRYLLKLGYRQTEGIVRSIIKLLGVEEIAIPSYSQINRRQSRIEVTQLINQIRRRKGSMVIAVDSTGVSLYSPEKWRLKKHGKGHDKWIKLHAACDVETGAVVDYRLTDSRASDAQAAKEMLQEGRLSQLPVKELLGDGAYDTTAFYQILYDKQIKPNIRIRANATYSDSDEPHLKWRDQQIRSAFLDKFINYDSNFKELLRRRRLEQGYSKRSLVENLFSRFKAYFGDKVKSRKLIHIKQEIAFKIELLNSALI